MDFFHKQEVLLLEDDLLLAKRISACIEDKGGEVVHCSTIQEAKNALNSFSFDAALLDLNLPDGVSLELLGDQFIPENVLTILMTGESGIRPAVEAMRLGAVDYLSKPFDLEELPLIFSQSSNRRKKTRIRQHDMEERKKKSESLFFGGSLDQDLKELEKILEADRRLSAHLPPLLIEGPTGSGKSTYARWVHANGARSEQSFVEVNCSAIPDNLIESELFGHEKGAFTDAKSARIGLFEAAHGGTLFLDEVASLSLPAQAKILLAIEKGSIRRLGGTKEILVDARIIVAANQSLRKMVCESTFREDLFHRLDLLRINIPPLHDRGRDILCLAKHFLNGLCNKYKLPVPQLSKSSEDYLLTHLWPGNSRELIHELERALVMSRSGKELEISRLNFQNKKDPGDAVADDWLNTSFSFPSSGFDLEKEILRLIGQAVDQTNGNVSEAARILGVPRDYVRYRLQKSIKGQVANPVVLR